MDSNSVKQFKESGKPDKYMKDASVADGAVPYRDVAEIMVEALAQGASKEEIIGSDAMDNGFNYD